MGGGGGGRPWVESQTHVARCAPSSWLVLVCSVRQLEHQVRCATPTCPRWSQLTVGHTHAMSNSQQGAPYLSSSLSTTVLVICKGEGHLRPIVSILLNLDQVRPPRCGLLRAGRRQRTRRPRGSGRIENLARYFHRLSRQLTISQSPTQEKKKFRPPGPRIGEDVTWLGSPEDTHG